MKYIVGMPEARLDELRAALEAINPEADEPLAVGVEDEDPIMAAHITTMQRAQWWYEDMIRHDADPKMPILHPWEELGEDARGAMAGYLSGFIGFQFDDFNEDDIADNLDAFLERHPEFVQAQHPQGDTGR